RVEVSAMSFVEYAMGGPKGRISIVEDQRKIYCSADSFVRGYYGPVRDAMRRAVESTSADEEFAKAVRSSWLPGQAAAFEAVAKGFIRWLGNGRGCRVRVGSAVWKSGDLALKVRPDFALCSPTGDVSPVLIYVKGPALNTGGANIGLRLMQRTMDDLASGGS